MPDSTSSSIIKIAKRIALEFGPPAAVGFIWMLWDTEKGTAVSGYFKQWGVAFFMASWVWAQLLRIIYQQDQRERLVTLGIDLGAVKGTLEALRVAFEARGSAEADKEISDLIQTANNQIATANTAFEAASGFVLQAETGRYRMTGGQIFEPPFVPEDHNKK